MKNKDLHAIGFRIKSGMTERKSVIARSQGRRGNPRGDCFTSFAMTGECGRSMVEMLGVLAIIGVLSVAGLSGFSRAYRKYRANEIVAVAAQLHMMVVAGKAINPNGSSYGINGAGGLQAAGLTRPFGTIDMSCDDNNNIVVSGASPEVCEELEASFGQGHDFTIECAEE